MTEIRALNFVTNEHAAFYQRQLQSLEQLGVHSDVISPRKQFPEDPQDTSRGLIDYLAMAPDILSSQFENYDIVHANYGLVAPVALAQLHRPIVLSLWGSDLFGSIEPLVQQCSKRADAVIVMNRRMQERLRTNATVIPHGVDFSLFKPQDKEKAQREIGWDPKDKHVLFPYPKSRGVKNHSLAADVVDAVNDELEQRVRLQQVYGEPSNQIPVYMNAADALLMTSKREGSPNSIKEALACNLPIVSTDVGDVSERVNGVKNSHVGSDRQELTEKLLAVLQSSERSNGRSKSGELRIERMAHRIVDLYEATLEEY